jgi:hypothetical protein
MIRLVSRATLFLALGLLVAGAAMAGVPNAANSTLPAVANAIFVMGVPSDAQALIQVTVRDAANNPVNNSVVVLNLNACNDYVNLSTAVGAGNTINCGAKTVSATTNSSGIAQIRISGVGRDGAAAPAGQFCASVTADGVPLGSMIAAAFDLQGVAGVNATDLGAMVCKLNAPGSGCVAGYNGRFDLNRDNSLGATDLGRLITCLTSPAATTTSASVFCP